MIETDIPLPGLPERSERVLVVDDEEVVRSVLGDALEAAGLDGVLADSAEAARRVLDDGPCDLVVADIMMPEESGIDLLRWCRERHGRIPFIVMTGYSDTDNAIHAVNYGAQSFMTKPFRLSEFIEQVNNALARKRYDEMQRAFEQHLKDINNRLRQQVVDTVVEQQALFLGCLSALAQTIDARDPYTQLHGVSVGNCARKLAGKLGLSVEQQADAKVAGDLHDIGKIAVPETILSKPARLTDEEYDVMKQHPARATVILEPVPGLEDLIPAILRHHEYFDGSGYPDGMKGAEIPELARVLTICDAWDAMTSDRPYRKAMPADAALSILREVRGTQIDPDMADAFFELVEESEIVPSADTTATT